MSNKTYAHPEWEWEWEYKSFVLYFILQDFACNGGSTRHKMSLYPTHWTLVHFSHSILQLAGKLSIKEVHSSMPIVRRYQTACSVKLGKCPSQIKWIGVQSTSTKDFGKLSEAVEVTRDIWVDLILLRDKSCLGVDPIWEYILFRTQE